MKSEGRRRTRVAKVVLGGLLTLISVGVSPALAAHSLSISHTPPSGASAGTDLDLLFQVSGDCEQRQVEHDESITGYSIYQWLNVSAEVSKGCDPLDGYLSYSNSSGGGDAISPTSLSPPDQNGVRTMQFTIPGGHVTPGTLTYDLHVWQAHRKATARAGGGLFSLCGIPVPMAGGEANPDTAEYTYATHYNSVEVPGSASSTTRPGKGQKPNK